jgi:hypothetical protein|tara:strand:- start:561 stop:842 length:282 start_codon:yes stop_codon:yes gene_type:complete
MDIETVLRISAIVIAGCILLSTINLLPYFSAVFSWLKKPFVKTVKPVVVTEDEVEFLEIVDLWYKLKDSCDKYGLKAATEKLGEVFPLLNEEE